MADKDFKVKNKLQVKGITSAGPVVSDASGNLDSTAYVATQYGGTGTSTSPSSGQILYSSSGTTYTPTDLSSLTISSSGGSTITNNSASAIGLVIKGAASQTESLQQWKNSAGTVVAAVGPAGGLFSAGDFYVGQQSYFFGAADYGSSVNVITRTTSATGIIVRGRISQTANLTEWQTSAGAIIASIGPVGDLAVNGSIYTNNAYFGGAASYYNATINIRPQQTSYKGIVIQGRASQTGNLQEWQDSAGTIYAFINPFGQLSIGQSPTIYSNARISINTVATTVVGQVIRGTASQTADLQQWQNSAGTVLAGIEPTGSFYGSSITAYGILTSNSSFRVNNAAAGTVAAIIKGAASQTADLQQWQNSAGTVLAKIDKDGNFSNAATYGTITTTTLAATGGNITTTYGFYSNLPPSTDAGIAVKPWAADVRGAIVRGYTSQTANLQEWQDSAGTVLGSIGAKGNISFNSTTTTAPSVEYVINASNPYPTFLVRTAGGSWINYVTANGTTMYNNTLIAANLANQIPLTVKGAASQTANLQEWQNSSGTVLASISAAGNLTVQDLTVNGTATTINSTTLTIDDKNIELASVASPTDTTADGAGITIKGATDKTFNWVQSTGSFTSSEPISTPALSVFGNSVSSNITLAAGKRYFVDTTAARTLTLPASPTLGDEIQVFDASGTAATNNITIARNGSNINGVADDAIIDVNQASSTFVYTGATVGWRFE